MGTLRGTPAQRREEKRRQAAANRVEMFAVRIRTAVNGREQLVHACNYALAAGKDLDDSGRRSLAKQIVALVEGTQK